LKYIGQFDDDPITLKRELIIKKAKSIKNNGESIVLIKGQDVDLENNLLNKLKDVEPEANHEIVFLHADLKVLFNRVRKKIWWSKEDDRKGIGYFKSWLV
jgi:hypothetical protein